MPDDPEEAVQKAVEAILAAPTDEEAAEIELGLLVETDNGPQVGDP